MIQVAQRGLRRTGPALANIKLQPSHSLFWTHGTPIKYASNWTGGFRAGAKRVRELLAFRRHGGVANFKGPKDVGQKPNGRGTSHPAENISADSEVTVAEGSDALPPESVPSPANQTPQAQAPAPARTFEPHVNLHLSLFGSGSSGSGWGGGMGSALRLASGADTLIGLGGAAHRWYNRYKLFRVGASPCPDSAVAHFQCCDCADHFCHHDI
jgi:hypothetical protein